MPSPLRKNEGPEVSPCDLLVFVFEKEHPLLAP